MKKRVLMVLFVIGAFTLMSACTKEDNEDKEDNEVKALEKLKNDIHEEDKEEDIIEGNNTFAIDVFREMNKEDEETNVFISPYSIASAMSMVYNGANGNTKTEIGQALGVNDLEDEAFNLGHKYLADSLKTREGVTLTIANGIFIRQDQEIIKDFIETNKKTFDAEIRNLDFNTDEAVDDINQWISDKTNKLIDNILSPPIESDVFMYLINAIYFKGAWDIKFEGTTRSNFRNGDDNQVTVDMMYRYEDTLYLKTDALRAVQLPYQGKDLSMYVVLPEGNENVNEFIENFTLEQFETMKSDMFNVEALNVEMPKFKFEYGTKDIVEPLKALGILDVFQLETSDLSGILEDKRAFVSRVLHKAVVEVNLEGTEAAAVTVVETKTESAMIEEEPKRFLADRPFMFIIYDEVDEVILFMGKVVAM